MVRLKSVVEEYVEQLSAQLRIARLHGQIHQRNEGCCCLTDSPCPLCPTHQPRKKEQT